jgi:tetratricopeptide (TPR) repeat protein
MMWLRALAVGFLAMTGSAFAQQVEAPPQCRYNAAGQVDYEACLAVSPPGSPWRSLSLMNLATRAYMAADFATAVRYYDQAQPSDGSLMYSDAGYHAYYAATLHQVGRREDAIVQARYALGVLRNAPELPEAARRFSATQVDPEVVYSAILPVLHAANDPQTESVMNAYLALPARDFVSWANRAAVMLEIGDLEGALRANNEAMRLSPSHPGVLNNQCYILVKLNRAGEALPHCLGALSGAPDIAAVRHSVASAYAALGRCREAEAELGEARRLDPVTEEYRTPIACSAR